MENTLFVALIPAYEPDDKLIKLVSDLEKNNFKIVVVDDGSGSDYDKIFDNVKNKAYVIRYNDNMGKGYALKKGIKYIDDTYKKDYIIVTMDCDGQHTVYDAKKLCNLVLKEKNVLYCGKRLRSKKTPIRSRFGNSVTRFIYNFVAKTDIYDTQTGLRAFSNELTKYVLKIEGNRYEYEMNMLLYSNLNNVKIKEEVIETIYFDNNKKSHFKTLKDSYRVYNQIFKFSKVSLFSFFIDFIVFLSLSIFINEIFSNIISKILAFIINFIFNSNYILKKQKINKYLLYLILMFCFSSLFIYVFTVKFHFITFASKFITEFLCIIISYYFQKYIIKLNKE